jgi:hypothetical protein
MKKLTYDEYVEKCLDEAEAEEKATSKRYTREESFAMSQKFIEELEAAKRNKRCVS